MRLWALAFAYGGTLGFVAAAALAVLFVDPCFDQCPPEADLAAALAQRLMGWGPVFLPGALALGAACILCLKHAARAHRWGWFLGVLGAYPVGVWLAALMALRIGDGHLLPTTWYTFAHWGSASWLLLPPLLLGPLATIVVGHVLKASMPVVEH